MLLLILLVERRMRELRRSVLISSVDAALEQPKLESYRYKILLHECLRAFHTMVLDVLLNIAQLLFVQSWSSHANVKIAECKV